MNLGTSLHWVSTKMQDKICLVEDETRVSYCALWENIELLAKGFLEIGIRQNHRIVIFLPNCKEFIYSFYALSRINAISIPLNQSLTPYELKGIFNDCHPHGIISSKFLYDKKIHHYFTSVSAVEDNFISQDYLFISIAPHNRTRRKAYSFKELFKMGKVGKLTDINTNNNQIATINYTYRGLGKPLGAMLTHGNYHYGAIGYVRLTGVVTNQRVLVITPMSHIFTLISCVIVSLLRGATIVIMKGFIPNHIFKAIETHKIDFIMAVPTIYVSLLKNYKGARFDISSLKYGITGGSYLPLELYNKIKKEMGIELLQGYGLTETVPVTCNPRSRNKPASLGIPGHTMKVKIVDDRGIELSRGEIGEIFVGGYTVMKGYYKKNGENRKFLKDGWFWTGDYGWMDKDGYLYFSGLKKDIVKIGGNNVDLMEVKDVLKSYKGVKDVQLDIVEDDLWGSRIEADVECSSKKKINEKDIRDFCRERLAMYKIPSRILVRREKET